MNTTISAQDAFDRMLAGIRAGELDPQLDLIRQTCLHRREVIDRTKGYALMVGDTVVFNNKTHPRYMIGMQAKVLDVNQVTAWVQLLPGQGSAGKFDRSQKIKVPFSLIDKVPQA